MIYVIRIWCSNCSGVDFEGCNGGLRGYAWDDITGYELQLNSRVAAEAYGNVLCNASGDVWDFEVEEWSRYGTYQAWNEPVPDCKES